MEDGYQDIEDREIKMKKPFTDLHVHICGDLFCIEKQEY